MSGNRTAGSLLVTAAEWFAGGQRIPYDPETPRVLTEEVTFPGGHLTTSEHPDLLAAGIRDIAARHGVSTTATGQPMTPTLETRRTP